jgi:toxin-antitoxin system PIN domain toxin
MALFLPDANVLIYALLKDSAEHEACHRWLTQTSAEGGTIALCEIVEVALLRIPTLPKLNLVPMVHTLGFWKDDLWSYPGTIRLAAGARHFGILSEVINTLGLRGNDINDAWLAALAIENNATLVSTDKGFAKYQGLNWINPTKALDSR